MIGNKLDRFLSSGILASKKPKLMKIVFKPSALKELERLPKRIQGSILEKIGNLADTPRPAGAIKLTNSNLYRIRVSTYRVIYEINDQDIKIVIIRVRHRRDAYGK